MDTNQDKSREHLVSDESSNFAEQMVLTSSVKCGNEQDAIQTEDSCSPTDNKTYAEELTVDETYKVSQSETPEKVVHNVSISFCALFESGKGAEQVQALADKPDEEEFESLTKATDKNSSETSPRTTFFEHVLPASINSKVIRPEVKEKYERNLKKFLEVTKSENEIRSRRKTKVSEKIVKSDEISKITDLFGNAPKISTVISKISLPTSSAPPTFSTMSGQIPQNERLVNTPDKSESDTSNGVPDANKTTSISKSPKPSVSGKTESDSSQAKVLDNSQGKSSGVFKLPTLIKTIGDETPIKDSPGKSKIKGSATTPTAIRPRDFNVQTRQTFYTFSPNSTTGVLRQCQSLPNINRPQRKLEKQRRSLILDPRSRIVRSLFSDEPKPSTSERRDPEFANINPTGVSKAESSRDKSESSSQEESSLPKGSHIASQLDRKPKMCRKLTFSLPSNAETQKAESAVEAAKAPKGKPLSPVKRKEVSPVFVESSSVKKVRISLDFKKSDNDANNEKTEDIHSASKEVAKDYLEPACSSGEKVSPVKRKAQEVVEDSLSNKSKVKSSKIVSRK